MSCRLVLSHFFPFDMVTEVFLDYTSVGHVSSINPPGSIDPACTEDCECENERQRGRAKETASERKKRKMFHFLRTWSSQYITPLRLTVFSNKKNFTPSYSALHALDTLKDFSIVFVRTLETDFSTIMKIDIAQNVVIIYTIEFSFS